MRAECSAALEASSFAGTGSILPFMGVGGGFETGLESAFAAFVQLFIVLASALDSNLETVLAGDFGCTVARTAFQSRARGCEDATGIAQRLPGGAIPAGGRRRSNSETLIFPPLTSSSWSLESRSDSESELPTEVETASSLSDGGQKRRFPLNVEFFFGADFVKREGAVALLVL